MDTDREWTLAACIGESSFNQLARCSSDALRFSNSDSMEIENLKRQLQDRKNDVTKINEELASI